MREWRAGAPLVLAARGPAPPGQLNGVILDRVEMEWRSTAHRRRPHPGPQPPPRPLPGSPPPRRRRDRPRRSGGFSGRDPRRPRGPRSSPGAQPRFRGGEQPGDRRGPGGVDRDGERRRHRRARMGGGADRGAGGGPAGGGGAGGQPRPRFPGPRGRLRDRLEPLVAGGPDRTREAGSRPRRRDRGGLRGIGDGGDLSPDGPARGRFRRRGLRSAARVLLRGRRPRRPAARRGIRRAARAGCARPPRRLADRQDAEPRALAADLRQSLAGGETPSRRRLLAAGPALGGARRDRPRAGPPAAAMASCAAGIVAGWKRALRGPR